jgi:acetamidase/formamidase
MFSLGLIYLKRKINLEKAKYYLKFVSDHNDGIMESNKMVMLCQVQAQINFGNILVEEKNYDEAQKYFLLASKGDLPYCYIFNNNNRLSST